MSTSPLTTISRSTPMLTPPATTFSNSRRFIPDGPGGDDWGPSLTGGLISAEHRPSQPFSGAGSLRQVQQSPNLTTAQQNQASYAFPGLFSPQAGLQSPFQANASQYQPQPQPNPQQAPAEHAYYSSNPSPRSTHSTSYYSKEKTDPMAAATATMQRPPYPTIYHTPQSNSPASVTSPQGHDRAMFSAPSQLTQSMYTYPGYSSIAHVQQPVYGGHHTPTQMAPQSMLSYSSNSASMPHHHQLASQPPLQSSPQIRDDHARHYSQTPQSHSHSHSQPQSQSQSQPSSLHQRHTASATPTGHSLALSQTSAPPSTSNAAPGPIPATTPLVVHQDSNGVQWIAFEYSRDRVKLEYTIRCDVESVEHSKLSQEFKSENCVYPRACVPKEQYKGNRLSYETECNQVGWALAELNPCLRGKRGLIQRAVDSWRNSNRDPRLRSRRVRRQAKMQNRSKVASQVTQPPGTTNTLSAGLSSSSPLGPSVSASGNVLPGVSLSQPQIHHQHHHHAHDVQSSPQESITGSAYGNHAMMHRPGSTTQHLTSPTDLRQSHSFPGYQTYPTAPTNLGSSMAPPLHGAMHQYGRAPGNGPMLANDSDANDRSATDLFGSVPEGKKRKFILVEDSQKNARVRVKVTLDQIETSEIPDSYRKYNSVFPRAYLPGQIQTATQSTSGSRFVQDDVEDMDDGPPIAERVTVPCHLPDGEAEVDISRLTHGKRNRERKLNELGYRMAWGQSRVFSGRPIFLARALDAYRNKQRSSLTMTDPELSHYPRHFDTRPGKKAWTEQLRKHEATEVPLDTISV